MVDQLRQHRLYILMLALNIAVLVGVIYLLRLPEPHVIRITTPLPLASPVESQIRIQVTGAIIQPGVYTLTLGSRVSDALAAAGGARPEASLDELNLALKLNDGDAIEVPRRAAGVDSPSPVTPYSAGVSPAAAPPLKININTANVDQLDNLPGIGPTLAQRIVDYRTQNGPFKRTDDIKQVKGIGDVLYDGMKALIAVQ